MYSLKSSSRKKVKAGKKFCGEPIPNFHLKQQAPHRKHAKNYSIVACVLFVAETCLRSRCLAKIKIPTHTKVELIS
jgi:hypothetical protein